MSRSLSRSSSGRLRSPVAALSVAGIALLLAGCTTAQAGVAMRGEGPSPRQLEEFHASFHEFATLSAEADELNVDVQQAVYDTFAEDPSAGPGAAPIEKQLEVFRETLQERDAMLAELELHPGAVDPEVVGPWLEYVERERERAEFMDGYAEGFAAFRRTTTTCMDIFDAGDGVTALLPQEWWRQYRANQEKAIKKDCVPLLEELTGSANPIHREWGAMFLKLIEERRRLLQRAIDGKVPMSRFSTLLEQANAILDVDPYLPEAVSERMGKFGTEDEFTALDTVLSEKAPLEQSDDPDDPDDADDSEADEPAAGEDGSQ